MFVNKTSQDEYYSYLINAADFRNQENRDEVYTCIGKGMIIIPFEREVALRIFK